jgi:hypothetical protein
MYRRPIKNQQELALLNEMAQSTNPTQEARDRLEYELGSSDLARKAFVADLVALRQFRDLARANKRSLPPRVRDALDRLIRARDYDHLVEICEQHGIADFREPGSD